LGALAVLSLLLSGAGCAGPPSYSLPASEPGPAARAVYTRPNPAKQLLYVGMLVSGGGSIAVFNQGGSRGPIREIDQGIDGPLGLFVDAKHNIYVANTLNATVTVYPRGASAPSETLENAGAPIDVVAGHDGTVYVANVQEVFSRTGGGSVLEYPSGKTKPSKTIVTFEKKSWPRALALDAAGDLFVAYNHNYGASWKPDGRILEFAPGSSSGRDLGIRVGEAGGLAVDKQNNLVLVQYGNSYYFPPNVDIFPPGSKKPSKQIPFPYGYPGYDVALNESNTEMWLSCPSLAAVFGVTYPGGKLADTITSGLSGFVLGVAADPDGAP